MNIMKGERPLVTVLLVTTHSYCNNAQSLYLEFFKDCVWAFWSKQCLKLRRKSLIKNHFNPFVKVMQKTVLAMLNYLNLEKVRNFCQSLFLLHCLYWTKTSQIHLFSPFMSSKCSPFCYHKLAHVCPLLCTARLADHTQPLSHERQSEEAGAPPLSLCVSLCSPTPHSLILLNVSAKKFTCASQNIYRVHCLRFCL